MKKNTKKVVASAKKATKPTATTPVVLEKTEETTTVPTTTKPVTKDQKKGKHEKKKMKGEKKHEEKTTTKKHHTALEILSKYLWSVKEKHMEDVLTDLMTEKEIKEFAERINILRMLDKGVPQRKIAADLGISVTTVSRWSKVLQQGTGKAKKYL